MNRAAATLRARYHTTDRQAVALAALAAGATVRAAEHQAGISRGMLSHWRRTDPVFARGVAEARASVPCSAYFKTLEKVTQAAERSGIDKAEIQRALRHYYESWEAEAQQDRHTA
jgi:transposase-like protein